MDLVYYASRCALKNIAKKEVLGDSGTSQASEFSTSSAF